MENWEAVAVETELDIERNAVSNLPEPRKGCGCLTSFLLFIVGIVLLRILLSMVAFFG